MATVYMMVGVPGSGKSTFSKVFSKEHDIRIISSDEMRNLHPDYDEPHIWTTLYETVADILKSGHDVIFDATNPTPKVRARFKEKLAPYEVDYDMVAYYFPIDYQTSYERILKRNEMPGERYFPLEVLQGYIDTITPPTIDEGFKDVIVIDTRK